MPKRKPGPTLRAQWLGQQLRALRESTGMTLRQAGEYLQRDPSMVSRFETAEYPIRRGDVLALLDLYSVSAARTRDGLLQLSDDVWRKGWWDGYENTVGRQYIDMLWLDSRAERLRTYGAMLLPGLLQTRDYAEALIRNTVAADTPEEQIGRMIGLRMARQQMLGGDEPVDFAAVVDESVLRRVIGGPEVMHAQLSRLLDVAERPDVEVRVLPLRRGAHAGLDGSFWLYEMPDPYPDVAYVDTLAGAVYVEDDAAVDRFRQAYHQLSAMALGGKEAAALIAAIAKEHVMSTTSGPAAVGREELAAISWHISTRSHDNGGQCVEAGPLRDGSGRVAVRHSHHPHDTVIVYTRAEWEAFTAGVRLGEFDFG